MQLGIPEEIRTHIYRVGAEPEGVRELVAHRHKVLVEKNAGAATGLSDARYLVTGAELADKPPLRLQVDLCSMDWFDFLIGLSQRLKVVIAEPDYPDLVTLKALLAYLPAKLPPEAA